MQESWSQRAGPWEGVEGKQPTVTSKGLLIPPPFLSVPPESPRKEQAAAWCEMLRGVRGREGRSCRRSAAQASL